MNADSRPQTILIVDDSDQMRTLMSLMLKRVGYNIEIAPHAAAALQILDRLTPDLIITDLMMPDMDGIELCRKIRQRPATQHTPILMRSYRVLDAKHIEAARAAGANDVMHLLVLPTEFLPRVKALLDKASG